MLTPTMVAIAGLTASLPFYLVGWNADFPDLAGLITAVQNVRFEVYDDGWAVVGAVVSYAGCIIAAVGASMIRIGVPIVRDRRPTQRT